MTLKCLAFTEVEVWRGHFVGWARLRQQQVSEGRKLEDNFGEAPC